MVILSYIQLERFYWRMVLSTSLHYTFERAESMVTSKVAGIKKGNSANQGMTISDGKINAKEQQS